MDESQEEVNFVREEVYTPQKVPTFIKRPKNLTPGRKYEIIAEEDPLVELPMDTKEWLYYRLFYRIKDDLGRIVSVSSCFFEVPADISLLYEDDEHEKRLNEDKFDLRENLSEAIRRGEAQYTQDITFCDMGIDPRRMTPSQAKSEWDRILKAAGIAKEDPKSEFFQIEEASQNVRHALNKLDSAIEKTETVMLGADKNRK